jgi:hypothetical protein
VFYIKLFTASMIIHYYCKELPNKDHATCGKEKFFTDCWAYPQVQREVALLKWVVGFIGGAKPWGREKVSGL